MRKWHSSVGFAFMVLALMVARLAAQQSLPPEVIAYPDMIFHNGKILTADDSFTIAQAVAIRDGKFLAIGENSRIVAMKGPNTRVIDLQGKAVTPGMIDTHFHLYNYTWAGQAPWPTIRNADIAPENNKASLLRAIRQKAEKLKAETMPGEWIVLTDEYDEAHGLVEGLAPLLTKEDLDPIFSQHPMAVGGSHHNNYSGYVVNSLGLKVILEKAPQLKDHPGMTKNQRGEMTGQIGRGAASVVGRDILPWPDLEKLMGVMKDGILKYNAQGLTMIQTKTPGYVMSCLRELWSQGDLTIRWRASLGGFSGETPEDFEFLTKRIGNLTDIGDSLLRISSAAGGVPNDFFDATYQEPKPLPGEGVRSGRPRPTSNRPEGITEAYIAAKYGWSMTNVHNNGDLSTDVYLEEIEKGLKDRVVQAHRQRFGLDHGLMLAPETPAGKQYEKMKKLGIIPSMNSAYLFEEFQGWDTGVGRGMTQVERLSTQWGRERVFKMLPVRSLINMGLKPTSESDRWYFPASYPMWILEKLITRKDDKFGVVWGPEEQVTRQEALWMKTNWAARYSGDENELGTIEPGKLADLIVVDQDYMTIPEDDISEIQVLMTVIGGKMIYDEARDGKLPRPGENYSSNSAGR